MVTIRKCRTLEYLEAREPERIVPMCHVLGKPVMEKYLINPNIQVTPLKLPPRKSKDEIACQWEFKIEEEVEPKS